MVGLSIIHFSVLSFLFFLKVYIWPLFFFCFWECMSLIYKKNEDNLVHTHVGNISLFFSFWMYMTTFFFFFFKNIWVCRVEEKTGKGKTRCDPADPTGWPGKTRLTWQDPVKTRLQTRWLLFFYQNDIVLIYKIQSHVPLLVFPIITCSRMMVNLILVHNSIGVLLELCSI